MSLRWFAEHEKETHLSTPTSMFDGTLAIGSLGHAGMDGRHPGMQDASGNVHVNLDSSTPCWNDAIDELVIPIRESEPDVLNDWNWNR